MSAPPRRQRLSAAERREQITAATVRVLAEHGYQGASADAIAREAGVSKGLLWHYFGGQDDLMVQTARLTLAVLRRAVGETLDLAAPVPDLIRSAVLGATRLRVTHGPERRAMQEIIVNLRTPDGDMMLTLHDMDDTFAAQEAIFRRGQQEGHVRADLDPRLLAVTYQGAVDSLLGYLDAHPELDAERYAGQVAEILLAGMQATGA